MTALPFTLPRSSVSSAYAHIYIYICRYSIFKSPAWAFAQAAVFHHQLSQNGRHHISAMDALEIICTRTTDVIMVRLDHGCCRNLMHS